MNDIFKDMQAKVGCEYTLGANSHAVCVLAPSLKKQAVAF